MWGLAGKISPAHRKTLKNMWVKWGVEIKTLFQTLWHQPWAFASLPKNCFKIVQRVSFPGPVTERGLYLAKLKIIHGSLARVRTAENHNLRRNIPPQSAIYCVFISTSEVVFFRSKVTLKSGAELYIGAFYLSINPSETSPCDA